MKKLIILDFYGTLIKADFADGVIRPGFQEFWEYYHKNKKFVLFSDGPESIVKGDLESIGLTERFDGVYDARHCIPGHTEIKNLSRVYGDFGFTVKNTIFMGDNFNKKDESSAVAYGVDFIKIPQFRQDPPSKEERQMRPYIIYDDPSNPFTFKSLIGKI